MRSNVAQYGLIAPKSLDAVLQILADSPDRYVPIAGGTELMVALGAGRLQPKKLVSLWNLKELRFIEVTSDAVSIGAATTFTDIRKNPIITNELSLLSQAASWTGSIANQNRGTLGGNIVNASPAADSPPALLAYEATVTLISSRGSRTIPYRDFHLSYKKTALAPDELLHSVTLLRNFCGYKTYIRKVGTRNAQAHKPRSHRKHTHRSRQLMRNSRPSGRHGRLSTKPTHYAYDCRRSPRRDPKRNTPNRRHPQHRKVPRCRRR
jgi:CO/xanthine dehydrogenase FAD-binding subunit